jgi:hypothetical protein
VIVTNKENMPSGFHNACKREYTREPDSYSITELQKGETALILERRYGDVVEVDCSEMVWLVFGSALHKVMEESTVEEGQFSEMAFTTKFHGTKISGHVDLYDMNEGVVCDYKTCSVWKVIFGDYKDWRNQTLGYCWLIRKNGLEARRGIIVALMKDYSKRDSKMKPEYPKLPVKRIVFDFTEEDFDDYESYVRNKIDRIESLMSVETEDLPPCTPEDRWRKPDTFAVMKNGRKTALRVLDSYEDAEAWRDGNGGDYIETRKGTDAKCKEYCSVCEFCPYWQEVYGKEE